MQIIFKCFSVAYNKNWDEKQQQKNANNELCEIYLAATGISFEIDRTDKVENSDDGVGNSEKQIVNMIAVWIARFLETNIQYCQNKKAKRKNKKHPVNYTFCIWTIVLQLKLTEG